MREKLFVYFYQSQNKFYLRSDCMNKSLTKLGNPAGNSTDRSRAKSSDRQIHGLTYTREIVIKTEEPDIPQITIFKVERRGQNQFNTGIQNLERILQRINLKKMFQGFGRICQLTRSSKLKLVNANRLITILKNRQKRMMNFSWLKLLNMKLKHRAKLNTGRLISKLSLLLLNKAKAKGFDKIKQIAFSKILKSATQGSQINFKQIEQKFQLEKTRIKSQQFSQKFINLCKKFIKPNNKNFLELSITELQPGVGSEIQRYQQLRNKKGQQSNNEVILIILNNHIVSIKGLKKDFQANLTLLKDLQKQNNKDKISLYQKIQKQFETADNQIRESFDKHKKIQERELARIVEGQLKLWTKAKDVPLYTSRLFISAIIVKLIKDGPIPFGEFLDLLENFLQISNDNAKLNEFKRTLKGIERGTIVLVSIVNKFMELNTLGLQPIIEKGFSENEQIIMFQIKSIKDEIRDFIAKFNNQGQRIKLKKTFSAKRPKAPQELRDLYVALNELMGLIQGMEAKKEREDSAKKSISSSSKNVDIIVKILKTFNDCLKQGNYKKWQNFLNTINKEEHKNVLDLLDAINDILNEKIEQQAAKSVTQIQKLKKSQAKFKEENTGLKNKNNQLQKKIKILQSSRAKQNQSNKQLEKQLKLIKQKDSQLGDQEKKYNELLTKFSKLQKEKAREKSLSASKAQNDKQLTDLKQKLGVKDEEINGLKEELKKIEISAKQQKNKNEQQKKKMQSQIDKQIKAIEKMTSETQKLKQELDVKVKNISQTQTKVKKYQIQIKKYERQVRQLKNSTIDSINPTQYNQILSLNEILQNKINELTDKIENLVHQLEKKQSQIKNMRNSLIKQQSNQSNLQKSKAEYEALVRKIEILQNTIQSLNHDLQSKTKRIQQYERLRRSDEGGRQPSKSFSKVEKNAEYSIGLIRQLNKQLQKLKRSEMTLEEINKQLQNVHHHGEDVQVLISKIQIQNSDLRKFLVEKDKIIFNLQSQINRSTTEINIFKSQTSMFAIQLNDKQDHIKRLEASVKDREALMSKDLQNKNDYIKKLQEIISVSEKNVNQLNAQILKLKSKEPEVPAYVKNQAEALQNALRQLKLKDEAIRSFEKKLYDNEQKYLNQIQKLQSDLRNSNRQNDIDNLTRQLRDKNDAIRNLEKKIYDNEQTYFLDRQKWEIQIRGVNSRQGEIDNLNRELRSRDETIRNLQKKIYDNEQRYMLDRQKWEAQFRNAAKQGQIDQIAKDLKIKIEIISNLQRTIGDNERKYLAERQRLQNQLRNYTTKNNQADNLQRELRAKSQIIANLQRRIADIDQRNQAQRQKLEQQLRALTQKYEQLLSQNKNLSSELHQLAITVEQQRTRITTMTSSRAINVDNIVLLLSNITSSFIRIHPRPDNIINDRTAQQIFNDLAAIKNKHIDSQNDMFMHLEQYIVRFLENDIGKYRYELMLRIDELNSLKDRLVEFLNNEIQISKNALSYQYQYQVSKESRERTADKSSYYETPAKQSQISKITQEISQIREKTINASRLFDSKDSRR